MTEKPLPTKEALAVEPILPGIFEPFQDRLSRDIRNDLSSAFSQALAEGDLSPVEALTGSLLTRDLAPFYRDYITSRLERYRQAFAQIRVGCRDPFWQGLVLWDQRLFFEVHEVLEHAWYHAQGERKLVLQAMIRAAGFYIKLEFGYTRQAAKMADKARYVLETNIDSLREYFAPEELLSALALRNPLPPILLKDAYTSHHRE